MKTTILFWTKTALSTLTATSLSIQIAETATFELIDFTSDGGGGLSVGGIFELTGTLGQADAGRLAGGSFQLEGGFWSGGTLLQTPGAPALKIRLIAGNQAVISWPAHATGFILEETSAFGSGAWSPVSQPVVTSATEHTVTVTATGSRCYRLCPANP